MPLLQPDGTPAGTAQVQALVSSPLLYFPATRVSHRVSGTDPWVRGCSQLYWGPSAECCSCCVGGWWQCPSSLPPLDGGPQMTLPPQSLPVLLGDRAHGRAKGSILALYSAQSDQLVAHPMVTGPGADKGHTNSRNVHTPTICCCCLARVHGV